MEEDREIRCLHATGEDWEEKDIMSTRTSVSRTHHCNLSKLSWVQSGIDPMHAAYAQTLYYWLQHYKMADK